MIVVRLQLVGPILVLLATPAAYAHPGVGIVQDSRGNVYFTDLKQVWKVTPSGKMSVAVPNVHAHELCLDADDSVYGEHTWYEGEDATKWHHRVWCLKRDGTLTDVIPRRQGVLRDYGFVRDRAGNMYWPDPARSIQTVIKKRALNGSIQVHAPAVLHDVNWMTATPDGTLYLIDGGNLRRVSRDGKVTTVVAKLSAQNPPPDAVATRHYHMGLWTDGKENVYVAVARERLVLQVHADGKANVVARSGEPWSPSGGLLDRAGDLWLLEYDSANAVRARRIGRDGRENIFAEGASRRPGGGP